MALVLITPPTNEPLELDEVKQQLRVDLSDDDALIAAYLQAAREQVEMYVRRTLLTTIYDLVLDAWPVTRAISLPRPPLQSVTSISYITEAGATLAVASANYMVDTASAPGRVVLKSGASWPSETLQVAAGIRVRFVAGWTDASEVPARYTQAIKLLVGDWYENRAQSVFGAPPLPLPTGVQYLLQPLRLVSL